MRFQTFRLSLYNNRWLFEILRFILDGLFCERSCRACLSIPELWFDWGDSLFLNVTLFCTRYVAGLVNATYLKGSCNRVSVNRFSLLQVIWYSLSFNGHIRAANQYLSSIHFWDGGPWKVLYAPLFQFFSFWQ